MSVDTSTRRRVPMAMRWLWALTAATLVALVVTKATVALVYSDRRATLASANELPSQILPRIAGALGQTVGRPWSAIQIPPGAPKPTPLNPVLIANAPCVMELGDLARDGWTAQFQLSPAGVVTKTASGWSDDVRIGAAANWAGAIWRIRRFVVPTSGLLAAAGLLLAAVVRRWRHVIAGCALVPVATCCVTAHLSTFADRTLFDPTREPIHWVPIVFVPVALTLYLWPPRRTIDGLRCHRCGYDLTGNVSGVCPECGVAISAANKAADVIGGAVARPAADRG